MLLRLASITVAVSGFLTPDQIWPADPTTDDPLLWGAAPGSRDRRTAEPDRANPGTQVLRRLSDR